MPWLLTDARVPPAKAGAALAAVQPLELPTVAMDEREIMPYECRTNRHSCGYGKCLSRYPRDDCVTMAAPLSMPFCLQPMVDERADVKRNMGEV